MTDLLDWIIFISFVTVLNIIYFFYSRGKASRLNKWYEYSVKSEVAYLHFSPMIMAGYIINSSVLLENRKDALNKLEQHETICSKSISLYKINTNGEGVIIERKLDKWSREGISTIVTTSFMTVANIRNILTLTISRKLYLLIFKNPFVLYRYKPN